MCSLYKLCLVILLLNFHLNQLQCKSIGKTICKSKICEKTAKLFMESIDFSADPCKNFYQYVCGNWLKDKKENTEQNVSISMLMLKSLLETFKKILTETKPSDPAGVKKMKRFYSVCEKVQPTILPKWTASIKQSVEDLGGWPLKNPTWQKKSFSWSQTLAKLIRQYDTPTLFDIRTSSDPKDNIKLYPMLVQVESPIKTIDVTEKKKFIVSFTIFAKQLMAMLPFDESDNGVLSDSTPNNETQDLADVGKFQVLFANISSPDPDKELDINSSFSMSSKYIFTIKELENLTNPILSPEKRIDWLEFFKVLFEHTNVKVSPKLAIIVDNMEFLKALLHLIENTDTRVLANFMIWKVIEKFFLNTKDFFKELNEISELYKDKRANYFKQLKCVIMVTENFKRALSYEYLKENVDKKKLEGSKKLAEIIKMSVERRVNSTTMFDEKTRAAALHKLQALGIVIGYKENFLNVSYLDMEYKDLVVGDDYYENQMVVARWKRSSDLNLVASQNAQAVIERQTFPMEVNAGNSITENKFYIFNAILDYPMFENERPAAINFGMLGAIIGHEILHTFDKDGMKMNERGNFNNWWTSESLSKYIKRTKCFVDFYQNLEIEELKDTQFKGTKINGLKTLGENIADIDGLTVTYEAFQKFQQGETKELYLAGNLTQLTPSQLFFVSYAKFYCNLISPDQLMMQLNDVHTPNKYRVIGTVANSPYFNDVFNCKAPSKTIKKCSIW